MPGLMAGGEEGIADPDQQAQGDDPDNDAPTDELFLDGQQRFIFHFLQFIDQLALPPVGALVLLQAVERVLQP